MCIRILHVVGSMDRGGTETLIMNLYRKVDRTKIQFDFVAHSRSQGDYDEEIKSLGGRIFYVSRYKGSNHFAYCKEWKRLLQEHPEYKIIHGHMRSTASIYLKIAKKSGRVTIAHSHNTGSRGNYIEKIVKGILQYPIRYTADYFLACSLEAGEWLFGKKVCHGKHFWILNNAINTEKFTYNEKLRNEERHKLGCDGDFVIGHVGNFAHQKNHTFIVDIFDEVNKKNSNCKLFLVGGGDDKLRRQIEAEVEEKGLTSRVNFLGSRDDVDVLMNAFDLFLFPSLHEGLGIVAIEAQASGLKCVLSDVIPHEVDVTGNVEYLKLDDTAEKWATHILPYSGGYERKNMEEKIIKAGYDINSSTQWLSSFYSNINPYSD